MSAENVKLVRGLLPDPDLDLAALFRDDALFASTRDATSALFDPEFESTAMWQPGAKFRGRDGLRQLWLDWLEPWKSYYSRTERLIDADDRVVVVSRARGRRHDTEAEVEIITATIWEVRDGRVVRIDFDRDRAFAVIGRTLQSLG